MQPSERESPHAVFAAAQAAMARADRETFFACPAVAFVRKKDGWGIRLPLRR